ASGARETPAVTGGLGRRRVLTGLARVRRIGVRRVAGVLGGRAGSAARIPTDHQHRRVAVHGVLLGFGVRVSVLLRLADLEHVLLLAVATAPEPAGTVAGRLRRGRALTGLALLLRIGVGLVTRRLIRRARARAVQPLAQDRRRRVGVLSVL